MFKWILIGGGVFVAYMMYRNGQQESVLTNLRAKVQAGQTLTAVEQATYDAYVASAGPLTGYNDPAAAVWDAADNAAWYR